MAIRANGAYTGTVAPVIRRMIDASAYHRNAVTWPAPLMYAHINAANGRESVRFTDGEAAMDMLRAVDGEDIRYCSTAEIGYYLVKLNSRMYNEESTNETVFMRDFKELSNIQ